MEKPAPRRLFFGLVVAVFAMATFVTALVLAFVSGEAGASGTLAARTWSNMVHYGWANGLAVALVFVVVWFLRLRRPRS